MTQQKSTGCQERFGRKETQRDANAVPFSGGVIKTKSEFRNEEVKVPSPSFSATRSLSVVFLILLCGVLFLTHAQQTIFNVPTTDVLDKGKVYVELDVSLPQVQDPEQAARIVAAAHQVCPYSNATRGNIDVKLTVNGRDIG